MKAPYFSKEDWSIKHRATRDVAARVLKAKFKIRQFDIGQHGWRPNNMPSIIRKTQTPPKNWHTPFTPTSHLHKIGSKHLITLDLWELELIILILLHKFTVEVEARTYCTLVCELLSNGAILHAIISCQVCRQWLEEKHTLPCAAAWQEMRHLCTFCRDSAPVTLATFCAALAVITNKCCRQCMPKSTYAQTQTQHQ